jgi:hypothetical protein
MTQRRMGTKPFCYECLEDTRVGCPRDPDAECLICGLQLCAAHIGPHLAAIHFCALNLSHCSHPEPAPAKENA